MRSSASAALMVAVAGSLLIHAFALFVPDLDLTAEPDDPPPLRAELRPLPPPSPPPAVKAPPPPPPKPVPVPLTSKAASSPQAVNAPAEASGKPVLTAPAAAQAVAAPAPSAPPPSPPAELPLSEKGGIRYSVYKGLQGLEVGRAIHRWEFSQGRYSIYVMTETSGLAAFFKPVRMEYESRGKLVAGGLQPESFSARKNGGDADTASFDWAARQVQLSRDGRSYPLSDGGQDFASFYYQLVFLPQVSEGLALGVATPRKFETYRFNVIGEETVDTPAGSFRTQHVRVQTDSTIELWLALDRQRLPVKIRYTDKKGDAFEQVAVEFGSIAQP